MKRYYVNPTEYDILIRADADLADVLTPCDKVPKGTWWSENDYQVSEASENLRAELTRLLKPINDYMVKVFGVKPE